MSTGPGRKPLIWVAGEIKTPPFSREGRRRTGDLLSDLQDGLSIGMPLSRPMTGIGRGVHELRINDGDRSFRLFYRVDAAAVLVIGIFEKRTRKTPGRVIDLCRRRLRLYDA